MLSLKQQLGNILNDSYFFEQAEKHSKQLIGRHKSIDDLKSTARYLLEELLKDDSKQDPKPTLRRRQTGGLTAEIINGEFMNLWAFAIEAESDYDHEAMLAEEHEAMLAEELALMNARVKLTGKSIKVYAEIETYPDPFGECQLDGHVNWYKDPGPNRTEIEITGEQVFDKTIECDSWSSFLDEHRIWIQEEWSPEIHRREIEIAREKGVLVDGVLEALKEDDSTEFCCDIYRMLMERQVQQ